MPKNVSTSTVGQEATPSGAVRRRRRTPPTSPAPAARKLAAVAPRRPPAATLQQAVVTTLRDLITQGELPPGVRLTERALCERLRVSRTPLREALRALAHEGLLELDPNTGARVPKLTPADILQVFEVLGPVEAAAGRLACERVTAGEIAEIKALHRRMLGYFLQHRMADYLRANRVIHDRIVRAAQNPVLLNTYQMLSSRVLWACFVSNQDNGQRWENAMREHEEIIAALERRDPEQLAALLQTHLANKFAAIRRHV